MMDALRRVWQRLRTDDQLAIISAYGACALGGIGPFAVYRLLSGNLLAATVDAVIVGMICLAVLHAWRGGRREHTTLVLAIINTIGCMASATVLGSPGLFWMYPALLGNFLLLERGRAVALTSVAFVFIVVQGKAYDSYHQLAMFLVTAAVSGVVAWVFASRTERQRDALERLATLDSLTGVQNRRAMERELSIAVEEHRRARVPFGLAMLDLDHFKRINDEHGHEAGDEVLVAFAELLRRATRQGDRCFRFGGEEFVLLMPSADVQALRTIDQQLRNRVQEELRCRGAAVTVSIGAAALRPQEDWQAWLARADAALYQAKNTGRNRTVVDEPA
jgi:diguanylate cyclase